MQFTERVHAFIAARYYVRLTQTFGERGKQAFTHATQYYALQRGRRMAQRAIRDGAPLNQASYNYYGEWKPTEEAREEGIANVSFRGPDNCMVVQQCPWHWQFLDMGLPEAGMAYCRYLDSSISRGFNPDLGYEVPQTLYTADCCIQRITTGDIWEGSERGKYPPGVRSFEYHCAHSWWTYREVSMAIFREDGERLARQVLEDLAEEYGQEAAEALLRYRDTNFNVCD